MLKLKEIHYKPTEDLQVFAEVVEGDLFFEGDHDDLVFKSASKYNYIDKRRLTAEKVMKISQGIIDMESAKKFLGKNLDKSFLLLRNSVAFQGNE
jgi:regulator of sirC expression with transglutaminase-like and TPR domain